MATELNVKDILDDISFLFYEFKDVYYKHNLDGTEEILFTEEDVNASKRNGDFLITRSPILCDRIIDSLNNNSVLDVIFDEIPFYHIESNSAFSESLINKEILSETRDPGKVDVPSALQTPFWSTWFRDSQGNFHNQLLLNIHNKLRYPFIFENQYINASLFPKLAQTAYVESDLDDDATGSIRALLEFKYTEEDNAQDINNGEQGCLDYLNKIIQDKILSTYALLDYKPDQAGILSSWAESLYWSGKLKEEDIEREKLIYRLQDIKYELLRRKFAGSSTLYNISFSAMDRRGSFVNTTSVGNLNTDDSSVVFDDKRIARVLDLPGLLTEVSTVNNYDPINTYYTRPKIKKDTNIDLSLLVPLFYTSATVSYNGNDFSPESNNSDFKIPFEESINNESVACDSMIFDASLFYKNIDSYGASSLDNAYTDYRGLFLRGTGRTINWDSPESAVASSSLATSYPKLDYYNLSLELKDTREYRTLDGPYEDKVTGYVYPTIKLDLASPILKNTEFTSSIVDLSADTILYNRNSQQSLMQGSYPYITYPLADGNSLSMMDIPWLDYIQASTIDKSRVQDDIRYGVQLSTLNKVDKNSDASYSFFAISYGDEEVKEGEQGFIINKGEADSASYSYKEFTDKFKRKPSRAYVWYVTLYYKVPSGKESLSDVESDKISYQEEFKISSAEVYPVTIISLSINSLKTDSQENQEAKPYYSGFDENNFKELDSLKDYLEFNTGLLPFTYSQFDIGDTYRGDTLTNAPSQSGSVYSNNLYHNRISFIDGVYRVYNEDNFELFTSLEDSSLSKAYFLFSNYNIGNKLTGTTTDSLDESIYASTNKPSNNKARTGSKGSCFDVSNLFTSEPSEETKAVYYTIRRPVGKKDSYAWSSPIPVVSLGNDVLRTLRDNNLTNFSYSYRPDWFQLGYHLNPFLNFSEETASPLRKKEVIHSYLESLDENLHLRDENQIGPSSASALSSLVRTRGMEFLSNDDGRLYAERDGETYKSVTGNRWYNPVERPQVMLNGEKSTLGFYLDRHFTMNGFASGIAEHLDHVGIFGDNRTEDIYDNVYTGKNFKRSEIFLDPALGVNGLYFENHIGTKVDDVFNNNYFKLVPFKEKRTPLYELVNSDGMIYNLVGYNTDTQVSFGDVSQYWYINRQIKRESGFSVFFNVRVIPEELETILTANNSTEEGSSDIKEVTEVLTLYKAGNVSLKIDIKLEKVEDNFKVKESSFIATIGNASKSVAIPSLANNLRLGVSLRVNTASDEQSSEQNNVDTSAVSFISVNNTIENLDMIVPDAEESEKVIPIPVKESDLIINNGEILLFSDLVDAESAQAVIAQVQQDFFKGILYDLRLYGRPMTSKLEMILTNQGTVRELYSYSPDVYKLVEHIHRDMGFFKRDYSNRTDVLPNVKSIRIFNRGTWDSILVDRCPITVNEEDMACLQYSPDCNTRHSDTDIFKAEEGGDFELNEAIQQELASTIEVSNGFTPFDAGCDIYFKGKKLKLSNDLQCTAITTTLQSTEYENEAFTSNGQISYITDDFGNNGYIGTKAPIKFPIHPVGDTLKYGADLYPNFKMEASSDCSAYITKGTNVVRTWNSTLNRATISKKVSTDSEPFTNFVELPLTIPEQKRAIEADSNTVDVTKEYGLLDKFYIKDFVINETFGKFLKASSYYKEFCIPFALNCNAPDYKSLALKWYGVRQLKEGVYYFTSKIPAKITPFEDNRFANQNGEYPVIYLASRFMVVVKGDSVVYNEASEEKLIKDNINKYLDVCKSDIINDGLSNKNTEYVSRNNRDFPHRVIKIDLYVMDRTVPLEHRQILDNGVLKYSSYVPMIDSVEGAVKSSFYWKKIASNYDDSEGILNIDLGFNAITKEIPLFLTQDLNTPFFVAEGSDSKTPMVRAFSPIKIDWLESIYDKEKLTINTSDISDSRNLTLIAGRAYRLLLGTISKVTELTYSNNADYTGNTFNLGDVDTINSYRGSSLIHNYSSVRDFMYNNTLDELLSVDFNRYSNESDFQNSVEHIRVINGANWGVATESGTSGDGTGYKVANLTEGTVGNPYSKLSDENVLYKVETESSLTRTILDNLNVISYKAVNDSLGYIKKLFTDKVIVRASNSTVERSLTSGLKSIVSKFIDPEIAHIGSKLQNNTFGIFKELSYIRPSFLGRASYESWSSNSYDEDHILRNHYLGSVSYGLYYLKDKSRSYSWSSGSSNSSVNTLYLNNVIKSNNFLDANYWSIYTQTSNGILEDSEMNKILDYKSNFEYVAEKSYGRDLMKIISLGEGVRTLRLAYEKDISALSGKDSDFEVAFVLGTLSSPNNIKVRVLPYYKDNGTYKLLTNYIKELESPASKAKGRRSTKQASYTYTEYSATMTIPKDYSLAAVSFEIYFDEKSSPNFSDIVIANAFVRNRQTVPSTMRDFAISGALGTDRTRGIPAVPLKTTGEASSVGSELSFIAFKKKDSKYFLPIQFVPFYKADSLSNPCIQSIGDFEKYILGPEQNSSAFRLLPPWVRRIEFIENPESTRVYGYKIERDTSLGTFSKTLTSEDKRVYSQIQFDFDEDENALYLNRVDLLGNEDNSLQEYHTNLKVNATGEQEFLPITLLNETVSGITNCFYPERFLDKISSPIVITNVQYLDKEDHVLYEYEFLPICYDETKHHISFNTLILQ